METKTKQNGIEKEDQANAKKEVQRKLTEEAMGKATQSVKTDTVGKSEVNLDERIQKFEKLKGLATQRERLTETLNKLTKFNYNQDGSCAFQIKDSHHLEFKTTNSNLIKLVTSHLQATLEQRKIEIERDIVKFEL